MKTELPALSVYRPEDCRWNPKTELWRLEVKFLGNTIQCEGVDREQLCEFINSSIAEHMRHHNSQQPVVAEHSGSKVRVSRS